MPYSFLHVAALRNDCEGATKYLDGGDRDHVHVWPGMDEKKCVIEPIDVDERDVQGWTPLMCAATHGHVDMCRLLVDYGADVNARKNFSAAPLHMACRNGHLGIAEFLLEQGADLVMEKLDNGVPLHDAAWGGHKGVAEFLLTYGEDDQGISLNEHLSKRTDDGQTPLHIASRRGHWELVREFINCGASITAKDEAGKQPHEVAKNRRTLIAFPNVEDPIDRETGDVGAMGRDALDAVNSQFREQRRASATERRKSISMARRQSIASRPRTGDVGNYTQSLGILREQRY